MGSFRRRPGPDRSGRRSGHRPAATLTVYFDTSALVKLLLREEGWEVVHDLWRRSTRRVVGRLAYPEARAALAAAARAGRIGEGTVDEMVEKLHGVFRGTHVVDLDEPLTIEAGDLADEHALRGYDGVHLSCALNSDSRRIVVATWDRDLARAANACGCAVVPAAA